MIKLFGFRRLNVNNHCLECFPEMFLSVYDIMEHIGLLSDVYMRGLCKVAIQEKFYD